MDQFLYQEVPEDERASRLEAIAEGVEKKKYPLFLTHEEQQERQAELSKRVMAEAAIEDRKKEAMDEFKDELKPVVAAKKQILTELKSGSRIEEGEVYKVIDDQNLQVGYYNRRGQLVEQRPMNFNDRQLSIKHAVNQ